MAASKRVSDRARPRRGERDGRHRIAMVTLITALSASLVFATGLAYAEDVAPPPTDSAQPQVVTTEPTTGESSPAESATPASTSSESPTPEAPQSASPSQQTPASQTPEASPSATTAEPEAPATTNAVKPTLRTNDPIIAPLAVGPDGAVAPFVYWKVVDTNGTLIGGASFEFERRIGGGWGGNRSVADCTATGCSLLDRDADPGEFLVKWTSSNPGNPGSGSTITSGARYRIQPVTAPDGYYFVDGSGPDAWVDSNDLGWSSDTLNFGDFTVKKVQTLPVCTAGTVYAISAEGQLQQITGGVVTPIGSKPSSGSYFNALGIGSGGSPVYALLRSGNQGTNLSGTVYSYNTATGVWTNTGVTRATDTNLVGGAVNLSTNTYYFGGFTDGGSFRIYEYTGSGVTLKATVATGAGSSANGDMAFDAAGNLFIVRGEGSTTTVFSVTAADFNAATGGVVTASQSASFTTMDNVNGVAFDAAGKGYLGASGEIRSYDMPNWSNRVDVTSAVSSTDLASCSSPATIALEKFVEGGRVNSGDQFKLTIKQGTTVIGETTTTGTATGLQGQRVGPLPTVRGIPLTFTETAAGTTQLNDYMTSFRCLVDGVQTVADNGTTGQITIPANGQSVECRFYNSPKIATVTVHKDVTDAAGQNPTPRQGWTVGATAVATSGSVTKTPVANTQTTDASGNASWRLNFAGKTDAATVTVSETQQSGYEFASGSCVITHLDGTTATVNLTGAAATQVPGVKPGDNVVCTYRNKPVSATVKVDKVWKINGTTVAHGSQPDGMDATLLLTPAGQTGSPQWGQTRTGFVQNQQVTINETTSIDAAKLPGCTLTGSTIQGNGITGTPALGANGQAVTLPGTSNAYTITNSVTCQTLTIVKQVTNSYNGNLGPADWNGKLQATRNAATLTFNHNETKYVVAGQYLLSETTVPGYTRQALSCTGATLTGDTVNVTPGSAAVCTFTNRDLPGAATVTKVDATNQAALAGAVFELWRDLNGNGAIDGADTQVGAAQTTPANGQVGWNDLAWGTYVIRETTAPTGYELSTPNTRAFTVDASHVAVQPFTFANPRKPGSVAWKKTDEVSGTALGGSEWTLSGPGVPAGTVVTDCTNAPCAAGQFTDQDPDAGEFLLQGLPWGTYTLTETKAPQGYTGSASFPFTVSATNAGTVIAGGTHTNARKPGAVTWTKVDSDNGNAPLGGSEWTVTGPNVPAGTIVVDCTAATCPTGPFKDQDPAAGKFSLTGLPWGTYTFKETKAPGGYTGDAEFSLTINAANAGTTVAMGNQPNSRKKGAVTWTKTDEAGAALGGSEWTLSGPGVPAGTVVLDCTAATCPTGLYKDQDPAPGKFTLEGLVWGSYTLTESKAPQGYSGSASFNFTVDATTAGTVIAGGSHVNTRLTGAVTWKKVDDKGALLGGSQWRIIGPGHAAPGDVFADCVAAGCTGLDQDPVAGQFRLTGLAWGTYSISEAVPPQGYTGTGSFTVTVDAANAGASQTLGPFTNTPVLGSVEWKKVDADDTSVLLGGSTWTLTGPGVPADTVVVDCTAATCPAGAFLDQDPTVGAFRLTGLAWGAYTLKEKDAPTGYVGSDATVNFTVGADTVSEPITLSPITNRRKPGSFSWTKTDAATGQPLAGSGWTVTGPGGFSAVVDVCVANSAADCTGPDKDPAVGKFLLTGLAWGTYDVTESTVPEGFDMVADFTVQVTAATAGTTIAVGDKPNVRKAGSFSWTKTDAATGQPLAGSGWTVTGPGGFSVVVADCVEADASACTGADKDPAVGKFLLTGLAWGTYDVTESTVPEGFDKVADFSVVVNSETAGTTIAVGDKPNVRKTGSFSWTKTDATTQQPLAGSGWTVTGPGGFSVVVDDCVAADASACTGPDKDPAVGKFLLTGLAWGTYTVKETTVPAGFEAIADFTVDVTASNAGTVIAVGTKPNVRKSGSFGWTKTDATTQQPLAGSGWTVTGPDGFSVVVDDCVAADASACTGPDKDPAVGKFLLTGLAWGSYNVTESTVPAGYVKVADFTVDVTAANAGTVIAVGDKPNTRIPGQVVWTKVAKGTSTLLQGSEWTLTGPSYPTGVAVTDCVAADSAACTGIDKDPAAGAFLAKDLAWGGYTLVETKAPPGYQLDPTPKPFTIGVGGDASLTVDLGGIENTQRSGPALPLTGGIGRDQIILAGAIVLLLAALAFGAKRFRSARTA